jgi:hypothetical protein
MPPTQDDRNARQIEALRRYVAELGTNRDRADREPSYDYDEDENQPSERRTPPSLPWLVLTAALVIAALVGGVLIGGAREGSQAKGAQGPSDPAEAPTTTLIAPVASPECKAAVDQANLGLTAAVKVRGVLGEYTKVMDDLRTGKIDGRQAAAQIGPYLALATVESGKFDRALADYRKVVDKCTLREP